MTVGTVHLFIPRIERYRAPFYELVGRSGRVDSLVVTTNEPPPSDIDAPNHYSLQPQGPRTRILGFEYHPGWSLKRRPTGPNDAVVLLGNPRFVSNIGLWREARRRGLAIVCWGIGIMPYQRPLRHRLRLMMFRHADAALFYSDEEVEALRQQRGFSPNRLVTATNNTIDRSRVDRAIQLQDSGSLAAFRRRHGLGEEQQLLLFVGTLNEKSRLDILIRALAMQPLADQPVRAAIVGTGPNLQRYQRLARDLGLGDRIEWVGPVYREEELAPWFMSATAYVYPGSVGLGVQHAFAYGLPVVSVGDDAALTSEGRAVVHDYNGLQYRNLSPQHLSATLATPSSARWDHLSAGATATSKRFSLEQSAERFIDAVEAAVLLVNPESAR